MIPFDARTELTESEKQTLRDNKASEVMRVVRKLIKSAYEQVEIGYLDRLEHKSEDLLVLKGEKLMARAIYNLITHFQSEPIKIEEKKKIEPR